MALAGATFVLLVAATPSLAASDWSLRAALVLVVGAAGVAVLGRLAWSGGEPAARAAVAWIGVAALATLLSPSRVTAVFGRYNWGTGLLFVIALAAWWAVGRASGPSTRNAVELAVVLGAYVNAAVAVVQAVVVTEVYPFAQEAGRSVGLVGNPVHLGALAVVAFVLAGPRLRHRGVAWLLLLAPLATAAQLSGSRAAILLLLPAAVWAAPWRDGAWALPKRLAGVAIAAALVIGLVAGAWVGGLHARGAAEAGTDRLAASVADGGVKARLGTWASATKAVARRPLVGSGPGTFRLATLRDRPLSVARAEGTERAYIDAHNLVVEYAVTTGVLGLAALVAFAGLALRSAAGPARAAAVLALAVHLVEPQSVIVTPLLFLLLGVAHRGPPAITMRPSRWAAIPLVAMAVAGGALLVVGDYHLRQAQFDLDVADAKAAERVLPHWPRPAEAVGTAYAFLAQSHGNDPTDVEASRRWQREAVRRDPTDPALWNALGDRLLADAMPAAALDAYDHALHENRFSVRALNGAARAEVALGRTDAAIGRLERSLQIQPDQKAATRLLAQLVAQREAAGP
jgi:O-antigen ligase